MPIPEVNPNEFWVGGTYIGELVLCPSCQKIKLQSKMKDHSQFYSWSDDDGEIHFQAWCKSCFSEYQKAYLRKHRA